MYYNVRLEEATLSITYNYSWFYRWFLDKEEGLRWLDGKTAGECASKLEGAIDSLGAQRHKNYWVNAPGNAGYTLNILLQWANEHPNAKFKVY